MQRRSAFMPGPWPPAAAVRWGWRGGWHTLLWLLVACVAVQGLASGTRRAFGPGHFHHLPLLADSGLRTGVGPHRASEPTPFGGRLRAHAPQASDNDRLHSHAAVERHSHAAGRPGVVTVDDGDRDSNSGSAAVARLAKLALQALDLPDALPPGLATARLQVALGWPAGARIAFDSRSTRPLLRPPRHG